jgi:hypothetical protein
MIQTGWMVGFAGYADDGASKITMDDIFTVVAV